MGQGRSRHGFKEARQVIVFPKFNWSIHMDLCSLSITTPEIPGNAETLRPREAERSEEHDPDSAHSPPHLLGRLWNLGRRAKLFQQKHGEHKSSKDWLFLDCMYIPLTPHLN